MLREELIFGDAKLPRWHEVERVPTWKGVRGQVAREVSEGLESDVLVRWPSVWQIPLEAGLDEGSGEGSVVPAHDQVDGGEGTKGLALVAQDIGRNDSDPEGVEGCGGVEAVAGVGSQVVVVECKFAGIPKEIEDTSTEVGSSGTVTCGFGGRSGLLEVVGKDSVSLIWKESYRSTVHFWKNVRMSDAYTRSSSSLQGWCS